MNPSLSLRHNRYSSWYNVLLTVTSNVDNLNLYNYITTNSPWTNTSKKLRAMITIAPGVRVSSASIATPALTVPTNGASSFRDYDLVIINNQGTIAGAAGAGGVGVAGANGSNGGPGGTALNIQRSRVFLNNTGIIGGGGGGGGAGGGSSDTGTVTNYLFAFNGTADCTPPIAGNYASVCAPACGGFGTDQSIACCGACGSWNQGTKCTYGGPNCWYCATCTTSTTTTTVYYAGGTGGDGEGKFVATNGSGGEGTAAVGGDGGTLGQTGEDGTDSTTFSGGNGGAPGNWINGLSNLTVQTQGIVYGGSA